MLFNALSLLAIIPVLILALPTPHGRVHRRDHTLIKRSCKAHIPLPAQNASSTQDNTASIQSNSISVKNNTTSVKNSTAPAQSSVSSVVGDTLSSLFPAGQGFSVWSTASSLLDNAVDLSNDAFNPVDMMDQAQPAYTTAPDGSQALQIHFNKGAYDYKGPEGGISFYAQPMDFSNAKEVTYSYSLYFSDGFNFNKGGKLPGMYGGDDAKTAISCSGGRRDVTCWSARFMFRTDGDAELYTYLPQPSSGSQFSGNQQLCNVAPLSDCNDVYGASVARGAWKWKTGDWTTVSQRITLNDPGQQNGEIEVIADGQIVINLSGLALRDSDAGRFQGIQMQSFFGGHDPSWASPQDQDIWTKDYSIAITQEF